MLKQFFIFVSFLCLFVSINAHDWDSEESLTFAGDLAIDFDDFPDNSTPDLEAMLDEDEDLDLKEFQDFIAKPDMAEAIDKQSEIGPLFSGRQINQFGILLKLKFIGHFLHMQTARFFPLSI